MIITVAKKRFNTVNEVLFWDLTLLPFDVA
jgi:hypothetical protein